MGELTVFILAIGMIVLCWIMIKLNDKLDRHIKRFKKLESALLKNSTRGTKTVTNSPTSGKIGVRSAQTSRDLRAEGMNFIAKH